MNATGRYDTSKIRRSFVSIAIVVGILTVVTVWGAPSVTAATMLISKSTTGTRGNGNSRQSALSRDGSSIAFLSRASNLVKGDTNNVWHIYVAPLATSKSALVSKSSAGDWANDTCDYPVLTANGRYVAFESRASNLVAGDDNGMYDIFLHDRQMKKTTLVSMSSAGERGNGDSSNPSISADGRYVAFWSAASNLVADDTNGVSDVFVRDRKTNTTTLVSASSAGEGGDGDSMYPSISADGRYVAFSSLASNLVAGDTNGVSDVFIHDLKTKVTTPVSTNCMGVCGNDTSDNPSISGDGNFVAFWSAASNLVAGDSNGVADVFLYDRAKNSLTLVSKSNQGVQGNDVSDLPAISADGRFVTFQSNASNLVGDDTNGQLDVFVYDRNKQITKLVSRSSTGDLADQGCDLPAISADGRLVTFSSAASNLVRGFEYLGFNDIFVTGPLK